MAQLTGDFGRFLANRYANHPREALVTRLRSPREAFNIYSVSDHYPRQRHTFMVQFIAGVPDAGSLDQLTFVIKSVDRPKVNPKTEELNQYNKRRIVFTGYKLEAIRMEFYDSADGAAQQMWTRYARYYFGDFARGSDAAYAYDIITPAFSDNNGRSYGFSGDGVEDPANQWYFDKIVIYHFYDDMHDRYELIHPRITVYEPDQLDYENPAAALIHMTFVYENLQYYQQQTTSQSSLPSAFTTLFDGDTSSTPDLQKFDNYTADSTGGHASVTTPQQPLFAMNTSSPLSMTPSQPSTSGGVLTSYGHFNFGPMVTGSSNATAMADITTAQAQAAVARSAAATDSSTTQTVTGAIGEGLLTVANLGVANFRDIARSAVSTHDGIVYSPEVYGAMNSQQTGTAQYGYNSQTA